MIWLTGRIWISWRSPKHGSDQTIPLPSQRAPPGYSVHHSPRATGRGYGFAIIYRNSLTVRRRDIDFIASEFELPTVTVISPVQSLDIVNIYRPTHHASTDFYDQLSNLLDVLQTSGRRFLINGDFNCPELMDVWTSYSLKQHVRSSTHELGNTLDLLIASETDEKVVSKVKVSSQGISDHCLVICRLTIHRNIPVTIEYSYRNIKSIDLQLFKNEVRNRSLFDSSVLSNASANQ